MVSIGSPEPHCARWLKQPLSHSGRWLKQPLSHSGRWLQVLPTVAATGCRTGAVALEPLGQVGEVATMATGGTDHTQASHWQPKQHRQWTQSTCVSSRHSRKCVTLLKLRTKLKTIFSPNRPTGPVLCILSPRASFLSVHGSPYTLSDRVEKKINHCWLCPSIGSHLQPLAKWLLRNVIKR